MYVCSLICHNSLTVLSYWLVKQASLFFHMADWQSTIWDTTLSPQVVPTVLNLGPCFCKCLFLQVFQWYSFFPVPYSFPGCNVHVCVLNPFSHVWLFITPWTVAYQASLSMGFSRQEYWSGLPCSSPRDLPDTGSEPMCLASPALAGLFFFFLPLVPLWKPELLSTQLFPSSCVSCWWCFPPLRWNREGWRVLGGG